MDKEIKSLTIEFKAKEEGLIEGYAAYFNNVDSYDDVIIPGAFQKTIKENMQDIKMVWNHDWDDVPIGNIIELKEDEKGLYFMAKLNNTTLAQDIKEAIKTGAVNKMSIGFRCTQYENKETNGKWIRYIKEIKLYEISPVNFPANDMATINSYKSKELNHIREIIREELKKATATAPELAKNNKFDEVMLKIDNLIKKTGGKE